MEDWSKFALDYFEPVCREVFDEYMRSHGFGRGKADKGGGLTYRRGGRFLELDYYVEDIPNYSPHVNIGLLRWATLRSGFDRIGLWYAIPEDRKERDYGLWRYSNAEELKQVVARIRDEVVDVYARPLWENPKELAAWIVQNSKDVKAQRRQEIEDEMLRRAKEEAQRAFRSGDYRKAAALYSQMDDLRMSPVEKKRLELSKKYTS